MKKVIGLILDRKIKPGDYQIGTGVKTSVNDLIDIVKTITGNDLKVKHQPYILDETEELSASNPLIKDYTSLNEGIRSVVEYIQQAGL